MKALVARNQRFEDTLAGARRLRGTERSLTLDPAALEARQLDALVKILQIARTAEPYRSLYPDLPLPKSLEDLQRIPTIRRRDLSMVRPEERVALPSDDLHRHPSTGTSGEILVTLRSPEEDAYQEVLAARQFRVQRFPIHKNHLHFLFSIDPTAPLVTNGNRGEISGQATVQEQAATLFTFAPAFVSGPPSVLLELGEFMGGYRLEALMTASEVLTPPDRRRLEELFGVQPFDLYATSEAGFVSWECPERSGYHVNSDALLIEVLDDEEDPLLRGEVGQLCITTLWNPTMPLVRYLIGDTAALRAEPCPCGITLPLLTAVEGRVDDRPLAHDGRRISPLRFTLGAIGPYHSEVIRFRVVQREVDDILMEIIWRDQPLPGFEAEATDAYSRALGGPVKVEVRRVDRIVTPRGKKFRWLETRVR